ncbi:MAG: thioredoxin family protein [Pseudomonadota bacterium]
MDTPVAATAADAAEETHADEPRPFDETRDAAADVEAAFARARLTGKRVLLVFGANWCHDSRGLAANFDKPALAELIAARYERVWIDVGDRDRNLDLAARYGAPTLMGTPTVLILDADGTLLNADTMHDWRTAYSIPYDETLDYFTQRAGPPLKKTRGRAAGR